LANDGGGAESPRHHRHETGRPIRPALEVSPRDVADLIAHGHPLLLVDCRRDDERAFCSIEGSRHVPMNRATHWIEELREDLEDAPLPPIVVFCHHGVRSMQVVGLLHAAGFAEARSMAGGIDRWSLEVDPSTPRY
jgi:rhodanese-related sulfurtransferase